MFSEFAIRYRRIAKLNMNPYFKNSMIVLSNLLPLNIRSTFKRISLKKKKNSLSNFSTKMINSEFEEKIIKHL